jgi:hypothetical protein
MHGDAASTVGPCCRGRSYHRFPSIQCGECCSDRISLHNLGLHMLGVLLRVLVVGAPSLIVLIGQHRSELIVSLILYRVVGLSGRSSLARGRLTDVAHTALSQIKCLAWAQSTFITHDQLRIPTSIHHHHQTRETTFSLFVGMAGSLRRWVWGAACHRSTTSDACTTDSLTTDSAVSGWRAMSRRRASHQHR